VEPRHEEIGDQRHRNSLDTRRILHFYYNCLMGVELSST
jgi:hypothetical protein